jgi:hypothetical protein
LIEQRFGGPSRTRSGGEINDAPVVAAGEKDRNLAGIAAKYVLLAEA